MANSSNDLKREWFRECVKQVPALVVLGIITYLFLDGQKECMHLLAQLSVK